MTYRRSLTGGLTEEQADALEQILERVGFIGDHKSFCELHKLPLRRVSNFLKSARARIASEKATDLSRRIYYESLKSAVTEQEDSDIVVPPSDFEELESLGLSIREPEQVDSDTWPDKKADHVAEKRWMKDQDPTLTDEEIKHWNKLANGKKK